MEPNLIWLDENHSYNQYKFKHAPQVPRADDCNNECEAASDVDSMADEIPYSELGDLDNINLLSFAYQIASGMVIRDNQLRMSFRL